MLASTDCDLTGRRVAAESDLVLISDCYWPHLERSSDNVWNEHALQMRDFIL